MRQKDRTRELLRGIVTGAVLIALAGSAGAAKLNLEKWKEKDEEELIAYRDEMIGHARMLHQYLGRVWNEAYADQRVRKLQKKAGQKVQEIMEAVGADQHRLSQLRYKQYRQGLSKSEKREMERIAEKMRNWQHEAMQRPELRDKMMAMVRLQKQASAKARDITREIDPKFEQRRRLLGDVRTRMAMVSYIRNEDRQPVQRSFEEIREQAQDRRKARHDYYRSQGVEPERADLNPEKVQKLIREARKDRNKAPEQDTGERDESGADTLPGMPWR